MPNTWNFTCQNPLYYSYAKDSHFLLSLPIIIIPNSIAIDEIYNVDNFVRVTWHLILGLKKPWMFLREAHMRITITETKQLFNKLLISNFRLDTCRSSDSISHWSSKFNRKLVQSNIHVHLCLAVERAFLARRLNRPFNLYFQSNSSTTAAKHMHCMKNCHAHTIIQLEVMIIGARKYHYDGVLSSGGKSLEARPRILTS